MKRFPTFLLAALIMATMMPGCSPSRLIIGNIGGNLAGYFSPKGVLKEDFAQVAPDIYTFRFGFDRTFLVRGPQGWLVVDSFNERMAGRLRAILRERFSDDRIELLVLSHYHLDHTGGIGALAPRTILTHRKTPGYLRDSGAEGRLTERSPAGKSAPPQLQLIAGDHSLQFGKNRIELLHLGKSHTDTLYAIFLPEARVLFGPDLAFVRAVPPAGMPDVYYPGFIRALDRVIALDFDIFVPSHFEVGTRRDVVAFRQFVIDTRAAVGRAMPANGGPPGNAAEGRKIALSVYDDLSASYGEWHGFREMFLPLMVRNLAGRYLGY